jgi:hypothetical protein
MKRIVIGIVVLVVAVFAISAWRKSQARNAVMEVLDRGMANLEARRNEIKALGTNIAGLETLVKQKSWADGTVTTVPGTTTPTLTVWADELRQSTPPLYDYMFSELTFMRTIVAWEAGEDVYPDAEAAADGDVLDRGFAPLLVGPIAIIEVRKLVRPEVTTVEMSKDKTKPRVSGEFRPGSLSFTVAIVDPMTAEVLASGQGEVSSSRSVRIVADSRLLMSNLRALAERKAAEIMSGLLK